MEAVDQIGKGVSPFISQYKGSSINNLPIGGIKHFTIRVGISCETDLNDNQVVPQALAEIPLEIPLICHNGVNSMVSVPQIIIFLKTLMFIHAMLPAF